MVLKFAETRARSMKRKPTMPALEGKPCGAELMSLSSISRDARKKERGKKVSEKYNFFPVHVVPTFFNFWTVLESSLLDA